MIELSKRLANLTPAQRQLLEKRLKNKPGVAEPIAIVGMSCRFGGAPNLDGYWRLINEGIDGTGEIPSWRWDVDGFYDPTGQESGKMSVKWAGMVEDVDKFDPKFFGISPREAGRMDPQQRMLLEVSWEALEVGGIAPDQMAGTSTGVFVGIGGTDYSKIPCQFEDYYHYIDAHVGTGNALSIAANRISYIFDLRGPSLAIDTACSSGMMGVHMAVQALRNRECDAALAGGVNAILTPETTIAFSKAQMLSADGKCRPFDAGANGYVRGEGCAMIVLKRLTDATRDGDKVLAIIRGSATNQDGRTSGITAPNGVSQQKCIRAALKQGGLTTDDVNYIEAHGTGTPLGDPIEVEALGHLFPQRNADNQPVFVTSAKANIGHTETVSGVAGIIKVVLMLQHKTIPRQTHFKELNPHMDLDGTRLRIPSESQAWETGGRPRIAGVSSFGFGGANTHVVIEEAAPQNIDPPAVDRPIHLMTLSAKSKQGITESAQRFFDCMTECDEVPMADICHTSNVGRTHFNHRLTIAAKSAEDLQDKLAAIAKEEKASLVKKGQVKLTAAPKVAFLFTGQGSQYVDMGRSLYETHPEFRKTIDQCDEILREHLEYPLLAVLYPGLRDDLPEVPPETINETNYTQPALFAIEYALASLWRSWGIEPNILIGHSVGEYVAAAVSGVLSLEDGLSLIAMRARLMHDLPRDGTMAVIFASTTDVEPKLVGLENEVSIAAANGPENTVISGKTEIVEEIVKQFDAAEVKTQLLTVSHAFHSPLMDPMLDEFEEFANKIEYNVPKIPIVSNLTGELITNEPPRAGYWRSHIRNAVRFADGMNKLVEQDLHVMLECGPAPVLLGMGRRCLPKNESKWLPSLRKGQQDWNVLLGSLSDLYLTGAKIDWAGFDKPWPRRKLILPTYPFERTRLWFDKDTSKRQMGGGRGPSVHPLLGSYMPSALDSTLFEGILAARSPAYLNDHQVQGSPVVPAAAFVEQGLAAAEQIFGEGNHAVDDVSIQSALFLPPTGSRTTQIVVSNEMGGECTYETFSVPPETDDPKANWSMHACGRLKHVDTLQDQPPAKIDIAAVRERSIESNTREHFYEMVAARGLAYGPSFQVLNDLSRSESDAIGEVLLNESVIKDLDKYHLHPALGDACFQGVAGVVPLEEDGTNSPFTYMPVGVKRVRFHGELQEKMLVYAVRTSDDSGPSPEFVEADVSLLDEEGNVLVELSCIRVQRVGRAESGAKQIKVNDWLYNIDWKQQVVEPAETATEGTWLVLADKAGAGKALANQLHEKGQACAIVVPGDEFSTAAGDNGDANLYRVNPLAESDYVQLLEHVRAAADNVKIAGIAHLWSHDISLPGEDNFFSHEDARQNGCASVLQLIRCLVRAGLPQAPRLLLATQGALSIDNSAGDVNPAQTSLWGMGRVAAVEHPEFATRLIDFDPAANADKIAEQLIGEMSDGASEGQVVYRGGQRFVARLARDRAALPSEEDNQGSLRIPTDSAFRLRLGDAGSFDGLWFEAFDRESPVENQVELEVRATGLNFSDVLKAMGLYPGIKDELVPLGIECSGVVTEVGPDVDRFKVGDEVMGVVPFSFASHARTADYCLVHKPKHIDDCEAATIPITYLTAYYALVRLADLQPGERFLIHAGAGGVGLAAIQIAQHIGAEIFATAGSDEKRDYLRSLGVKHVFNSRNLDFADEIMEVTNREGVDVVLNSLPGDAITKSLGLLRAYGRFLEIGKIDIYKNSMIGLAPFQDNLSYFAIDLDRMLRQRGDYMQKMNLEMMEYFDKEIYKPLVLTQFAIEDTVDAFRYMAARKNTGKVIVSLERDEVAGDDAAADAPSKSVVREDATYLITGGLGALGLRVADWLADQGAKHIALMSRRAPGDEVLESINAIKEKDVCVTAIQGDATDLDSLNGALGQIPSDCPPLRGVIHAAGVLADGVMYDMSLEQLDKAMAPKVQGGWNLHAATLDKDLDFFVLFSSVACVLGSPGQGNYAAGNSFLDGLASYRRSKGLPATSVNWGPWAGSGMAAEGGRDDQIKSKGMDLIPPEHGLAILNGLIENNTENVTVMDAHWTEMMRLMSGRVPSMLKDIAENEADASDEADLVDHELRDKLTNLDLPERQKLMQEHFTEELARIMAMDESELDEEQPLNELGMDSLLAMELKNNLERRLSFVMPMAAFLETPNIVTLAKYAARALTGDVPDDDVDPAAMLLGRKPKKWSPLEPLREGEGRPIFCVHPLGGDCSSYYGYASGMPEGQPVYALRGRGNDGQQDPHQSLDEMVEAYLDAIKSVQPEGPYRLTSWSAGGIFSLEMCRVLKERGEQVELLAWFDTPLPSIYDGVDLSDELNTFLFLGKFTNRLMNTEIDVEGTINTLLKDTDSEERWQIALAIAKQNKLVPDDATIDHVKRMAETGRSHANMIQNYTLPSLEQSIHLFRPEQPDVLGEMTKKTLAQDLGWTEVLGDRLVLHESPGDHFTMLEGDNAAELARRVNALLETEPAQQTAD